MHALSTTPLVLLLLAGFAAGNYTTYTVAGRGLRFDQCAHLCASKGATLPCIRNETDNRAVLAAAGVGGASGRLFVGIYQAAGSASADLGWRWVGAGCNSTYRNWGRRQPDDRTVGIMPASVKGQNEECALLWFGERSKEKGKWDDAVCRQRHGVSCVCELPGHTALSNDELAELVGRGMHQMPIVLIGCAAIWFVLALAWGFSRLSGAKRAKTAPATRGTGGGHGVAAALKGKVESKVTTVPHETTKESGLKNANVSTLTPAAAVPTAVQTREVSIARATSTARVAAPEIIAAASMRLHGARREARRLRWKVSAPALVLGAVLGPVPQGVFLGPAFLFFLLAVLPTYLKVIRVLAFVILFSIGALGCAIVAVFLPKALREGDMLGAVNHGCNASVTFVSVVAIVMALCRYKGWRRYGLLNALWQVIGFTMVSFGVIGLATSCTREGILVAAFPIGSDGVWEAQAMNYIISGALMLSPHFRRKAQVWLASRGGVVAAAAGVAALLGGTEPREACKRAEGLLRCVSLGVVVEKDMAKSRPDASLARFSEPCKFFEVDAFFSHSWSDDSVSKWNAIQQWRQNFVTQHGREPLVWIDKYCIDQEDIDSSLMCLPVFLAACNKLVIFAGPTYLHRLWCVEELFVYLEMGGTPDNMETYSIGGDEERRQFIKSLDSFHANRAKCFLKSDEVRLKAAIEAGAGDMDVFNTRVSTAILRSLSSGDVTLPTAADAAAAILRSV